MKFSFDLVNQKWIPVVTTDFKAQKAGLAELLMSAHAIKEISAATPIETVVLYRLCLSLLHAMIEVTEDKWKSVWGNKQFDPQVIHNYFEKWSNRFDLFDPQKPFLQDSSLVYEPEPASSLLGHFSSGNDSTLFNHNTNNDTKKFSPPEAVMGLLSILSFGVGGTKRKGSPLTDGYCARGIVFLVKGSNLFETLMLNLYAPSELTDYRLTRRGDDKPAWEMDDPYESNVRRPYGLMDHLTWLNRRVLLLPTFKPDGEICVQHMRYDAGLRTSEGTREVFNPMYHWRPNLQKTTPDKKSRSHSPMGFSLDKALWRNSHVILKLAERSVAETQREKSVAALGWVRELIRQGTAFQNMSYSFSGYGAATESGQDKTFFYRSETIPLSLDFLSNDSLVEKLSIAITEADKVAEITKDVLRQLSRWLFAPNKTDAALGKEDRERISQLARSWNAEERYWAALEPHFHRLITDLPRDPDKAAQDWHDELCCAAKNAFGYAEQCVSGDPRAARAIAVASPQFYGRLKSLFPKQPDAQETAQESDS